MEYAILDIETTGGKYNEEGITEIAIYRFDGDKVVDQFASLVNPEIPIQPFVVNLTGINNAMLRTAPKFHEVAKRIIEITNDAILVAHNAQFDNRILTTEFDRLGYNFDKQTLCTVELAKQLMPDMASYSLGKLVQALGIPIANRHRAGGDALATVIIISAANFAGAILIESGLSFLGIGAQPPMPSWGGIIKDHYSYIVLGKPYLAIIPGLAIMSLVTAFMLVGNALRDALDVKN